MPRPALDCQSREPPNHALTGQHGTMHLNGAIMSQSRLLPAGERILEPLIELARCSTHHRIIVAGAKSAALMFELHRRGYVRVATTANCGLPAGQYEVALVDWRERSLKALDTTLDWMVDFLSPAGALVVWIDPQEPAGNRKLRVMLEKHGLIVEAGIVREHGCAVSAQRAGIKPISRVVAQSQPLRRNRQ
jgi:hypothetical protein